MAARELEGVGEPVADVADGASIAGAIMFGPEILPDGKATQLATVQANLDPMTMRDHD